MSDKKDAKPEIRPIPENLPEELLPLYDWWKANGARAIAVAALAAIAAAGIFGFRQYRENQLTGANLALVQAQSVDELETALAQYGSFKAANALRLRLAKAYFDAGRAADAVATYRACLDKGVPAGFEDHAALGLAFALEGDKQYAESLAAFRAFAAERADSPFLNEAKFGEIRSLFLSGDKAGAEKLLAEEEEKAKDDEDAKARVAGWKALIGRYVPRAEVSLFDKADAAAQDIAVPEIKEEAAPAADAKKAN